MKELYLISVLLFFGSCYFNASVSNEESEKEKGEKIANIFYEYIINQNYDGSIEPYLSKELLIVTPINQMDSLLLLINNRSGHYKSRVLEKWSTKRQKGTDELWECVLIYSVQYEKGKSTELFKLIKENDSIKILNYNFRSKDGLE
ncbi:MAG: hypothetical protein WDA08_06115 [Weeksellaceae bacterium]